eukprot:TRINITY_DN32846_c0_g1_i1.p1 TRINITY_DN32846_c0_g1~~TRINITY_DN32846_c0_g1_i1.p1  ORF type:complete len:424 (+),score=103.47 TRINITY_DN32846_c0_g1_i1:109-1380(+)
MDDMRKMLDSLMGKDRNAAEDGKKQSFKDRDVCKHYLVGDCPHEFWVNQEGVASKNSPVGACRRQHSEAMRERFKADKDYVKYRWKYLEDVKVMLQKLVDENDAHARRTDKKISAGVTCSSDTTEAVDGHLHAREVLVNEKVQAAERMAEEGDMETSKQALEEAEQLAHQKYRLTRLKEVAEGWMDECCKVCGSQISWRAVEELEARRRGRPHPHVPGSWHQGWEKCRSQLETVLVEVKKAREACRGMDLGDIMDDNRRDRSRSKDRKRSRSRDKKRSEERREERRKKRRSLSRDKKKSPSKTRKRSSSKTRKRSSSRNRKRSRSKERKRSSSKDRKRSRSKDRKRSRSKAKRRSISKSRKRRSVSKTRAKAKEKDKAKRGKEKAKSSRSRSESSSAPKKKQKKAKQATKKRKKASSSNSESS